MSHDGLIEEEASELILVIRETELKERVLFRVQLQNSVISLLPIIGVALNLET